MQVSVFFAKYYVWETTLLVPVLNKMQTQTANS